MWWCFDEEYWYDFPLVFGVFSNLTCLNVLRATIHHKVPQVGTLTLFRLSTPVQARAGNPRPHDSRLNSLRGRVAMGESEMTKLSCVLFHLTYLMAPSLNGETIGTKPFCLFGSCFRELNTNGHVALRTQELITYCNGGKFKLNCELPDCFLDRLQQQVLLVVYFQNKFFSAHWTLPCWTSLDFQSLSCRTLRRQVIFSPFLFYGSTRGARRFSTAHHERSCQTRIFVKLLLVWHVTAKLRA